MIQPLSVPKLGEAAAEQPELKIGPYRTIRILGRGGMGTVYLATRDDGQFRKLVALKIINGPGDPMWKERFRRERQILAQLNHPNIAGLLDGGETEDGCLYEAMEYVAGAPIQEYVASRDLGVEEKLRLLLQVCAAISYAHSYLIVHRDIKPPNILVTDTGIVKLLDFGIAKVLRPELFAMTGMNTGAHERLLTPFYASPEQVKGSAITTGSDVYSLGILLFELLTKRLPYRSLGTGLDLVEAICTAAPMLASEAVEDAELKKRLSGDLDTILSMALRKEPDARYSSVEQFAQDIQRFLDGYPVQARRATGFYTARKFVQRNAVAITAGALVIGVLVASSVVTFRMAQQAKRERDTSNAIAQYVGEVLAAGDPYNPSKPVTNIKDALRISEARLEKQLENQPEVRAGLLTIIGNTWRNMGDAASARPALEKSLALRRQTLGNMHPDTAKTMQLLGRTLLNSAQYAAAEKLLLECLTAQRASFGEKHAEVVNTKNALGLVYYYLHRYKDAEKWIREAYDTMRILPHNSDTGAEAYGDALNNLALILQAKNDFDGAGKIRRELTEFDIKQFGPTHPNVLQDEVILGNLLHEDGKDAEAEPILKRALEGQLKVYGSDSPVTAYARFYTAACLLSLNKLDEAGPIIEQLLPLRLKAMGEKTTFHGLDLWLYSDLLRRRKDFGGAKKAAEQSMAVYQSLPGQQGGGVSAAHFSLGKIAADQNNFELAEVEYRKALDLLKRPNKPWEPRRAMDVMLSLADVLARKGKRQEAEELFQTVLAVRRERLAADHPLIVQAQQAREAAVKLTARR